MLFWFAQIAAALGCGLSSYSYFRRERIPYLWLQAGASVLYLIEYALLSTPSGVVNNGVWVVKYIVFILLAMKGKDTPKWLTFLFCAISVVMGAFAVGSAYDLVPIVVSLLFTIAVAWGNPYFLRGVVICGDIGWIVYNLHFDAYVSAGYSAIELVMTAISLILVIRRAHKSQSEPLSQ